MERERGEVGGAERENPEKLEVKKQTVQVLPSPCDTTEAPVLHISCWILFSGFIFRAVTPFYRFFQVSCCNGPLYHPGVHWANWYKYFVNRLSYFL